MEGIEHPAIFQIPNFLAFIIPGRFIPEHVVMTWVTMAILIGLAWLATRRLEAVPGPVQGLLEVVIEAFTDLLKNVVGPRGPRYLPLIGTAGLFILVGSCLVLIPGLKSPTSNLNTTAGLALTVFLAYHYFGVKEHGLWPYLKHFFGPVGELPPALRYTMGIPFAAVFFIVECISHAARPLSLSIRLFGNIFGEDTVVAILIFLWWLVIPYGILLGIMLPLMIFTAIVQAFIFVMLSMVYIAGAVETGHGEEAHH